LTQDEQNAYKISVELLVLVCAKFLLTNALRACNPRIILGFAAVYREHLD